MSDTGSPGDSSSGPSGDPPVTPAGPDGAAPVLGRRERKKQATRAALREAALRLSLRHGVENVTVEQIADEADIALRTFFNYFSSKEEAVVASVEAAARELITEFRSRPGTETVLQAFREAVLAVLGRSAAADRDYVRALRLIRAAPTLAPRHLAMLVAQEQALAEAITERIGHLGARPGAPSEAGPPADDVYPSVCAAAALAALRVVLDQWVHQTAGSGEPPDPALLGRRFDTAIAELAAGLDRPGRPAV
ncbi:TetR/AcrR family transcriptional regulator [Thermopolyspora sp. NPDC052614]|uniref:TetR/AcrR family transcriptional regulator n=1 Tax=Thermopolyspora sp. NPDC052614 TaxID=3155682 RepID=UPI00343E53CD